MAEDFTKLSTEELYKLPIPNIVERHCAAGMIVAATGSGNNPVALVNEYNLKEKKKQLIRASYDARGITISDATIDLAADCARPVRHSRTLTTNLKKASGQAKPDYTDAHHIVAVKEPRAHTSRLVLFSKGIGINDVDNGDFYPRYCHSFVPSMPHAHNHQGLHSDVYYINVRFRLMQVANGSSDDVRMVLRKIKSELRAGTFPIK